VEAIRKLGKEAKDEIALAKAQADRQDQELQAKEREAASRQRSRLQKFTGETEKELNIIKNLQLLQSKRRSSQYFQSVDSREILTCLQ
jgi:hypothetical protein